MFEINPDEFLLNSRERLIKSRKDPVDDSEDFINAKQSFNLANRMVNRKRSLHKASFLSRASTNDGLQTSNAATLKNSLIRQGRKTTTDTQGFGRLMARSMSHSAARPKKSKELNVSHNPRKHTRRKGDRKKHSYGRYYSTQKKRSGSIKRRKYPTRDKFKFAHMSRTKGEPNLSQEEINQQILSYPDHKIDQGLSLFTVCLSRSCVNSSRLKIYSLGYGNQTKE
jgi:hypothetical protein